MDVCMDDNERIDADSDVKSFAEEDWKAPEQNGVPEVNGIRLADNSRMRDLTSKEQGDEGQSLQQVEVSAEKKRENERSPLRLESKRQTARDTARYFRPSIIDGDIDKHFGPWSWCRTYPHRKLDDKRLREVRETNGLELDKKEAETTIGRNFKTKFNIPNEYSKNILITDSDFILSDRTSAICITADISFKSRLEADFKRKYQNVELLFRQRPGL